MTETQEKIEAAEVAGPSTATELNHCYLGQWRGGLLKCVDKTALCGHNAPPPENLATTPTGETCPICLSLWRYR